MKEAMAKLNRKEPAPADGSRPSQRNIGKYDFTMEVRARACSGNRGA